MFRPASEVRALAQDQDRYSRIRDSIKFKIDSEAAKGEFECYMFFVAENYLEPFDKNHLEAIKKDLVKAGYKINFKYDTHKKDVVGFNVDISWRE